MNMFTVVYTYERYIKKIFFFYIQTSIQSSSQTTFQFNIMQYTQINNIDIYKFINNTTKYDNDLFK